MTRVCEQCGVNPCKRGGKRFCSPACQSAWQRVSRVGVKRAAYITPPSTAPERIRANGLINMRLRRGHITKPDRCDRCRLQKRLDSHHPDYAQPDLVAWLCRSCHMQAHHSRFIEFEVAQLARVARREAVAS
jgi:hypothetical protein